MQLSLHETHCLDEDPLRLQGGWDLPIWWLHSDRANLLWHLSRAKNQVEAGYIHPAGA